MDAHPVDFCRGIAMVLKGENLKASCYVTHDLSLGVLREKMVNSFVRHGTPERFRVETGLIHNSKTKFTSRQCDLLIYDPNEIPPFYRWEDFVVVAWPAVRGVVEVKSNLDQEKFDQLMNVHKSADEVVAGGYEIRPINKLDAGIPTFGYALEGVTFDTFISYVKKVVTENPLGKSRELLYRNVPVCIAVQKRRYVGMRHLAGDGKEVVFCAVDTGRLEDETQRETDGIETGIFIWLYRQVMMSLAHDGFDYPDAGFVRKWFNGVVTRPGGKVWIDTSGVIHEEDIP